MTEKPEQQLAAMRIVVTGGAGFIGSELTRQLLQHGAQVTVIDNLVNGNHENISTIDDSLQSRLTFVEADIRDEATVIPHLRNVDIVYHLACMGVRHSIHAPFENHDVNATATLRLLQGSRQHDVSRFVYVSTSEVYGSARTVPMTELHPTLPHTVYGASKLAGEGYTRAFHDTYDYETVVVRPFNSYGPRSHHEGDSGEVIPKFLLRSLAGQPLIIFGDGEQTRDFTFVADSAAGILRAGLVDEAIGQTINLGSQFEVTINQLASLVKQTTGSSSSVIHDQPRPGDVRRLYADSTKARELLQFTPSVTLEQGLDALLEWIQADPQSVETRLEQEIVHNWQG